jgi:hypothetical protein
MAALADVALARPGNPRLVWLTDQPPAGQGLFTAGVPGPEISTLLMALGDIVVGTRWPDWLGVPMEAKDAELAISELHKSGFGPLVPAGTLHVEDDANQPITFQLFRLPAVGKPLSPELTPAPVKIPEGPDAVRRREAWFQKRSGRRP